MIVTLVIDGETIHTTPAHGFYANNHWIDAGKLHVGDAVRKEDGTIGDIEIVSVAYRAQVMYNLTVAQAHTFFVGYGLWLVHNVDCGNALDIAKSGGKHSGFYQTYLNKASNQILSGIKSVEVLIAEHEEKIANPSKYVKNWNNLDPRQQQALLEKIWPNDIQRQQEQLQILLGIMEGRGK